MVSLANGWRGVGYANGIGKISLSDLFPAYSVGGFPEDGFVDGESHRTGRTVRK